MQDKEWEDNQREIKEINRLREERQKEGSKRQLEEVAAKRIKTTMIGAIASIEDKFGFLWNFGNPQTKDEKDAYEVFQEIRHDILEKGNKQIRDLTGDLQNYTVTFNKFKTHFIFKKLGE